MNRRYELIESDSITAPSGAKLYRIRALQSFGNVIAGEVGGYIEYERNLSQEPCAAWVYGSARVFGNARVFGDARVFDSAIVSGDARVGGDARVSGSARVFGDAIVRGALPTCSRSDGYTFAVAATPAGPRIMAGCRYFSFDEAIAHWTKKRGGTKLGDESLSIVTHLRNMATINGLDAPVTEETAA